VVSSETVDRVAVELCVDHVGGSAIAERSGVDRVELCAELSVGGVTPSSGLVALYIQRLSRAGIQVLIRPRAGCFVYDDDEIEVMERDLRAMAELGAGSECELGFVFGALDATGRVERDQTRRLVEAAEGAPCTFHRAVDSTKDLDRSVETLVEIGLTRVLSSGGAPSALEGSTRLAGLVARFGSEIAVMAGGRIRGEHLLELLTRSSVSEIHLGPTLLCRRVEVGVGAELPLLAPIPSAGEVRLTDVTAVASVMAVIDQCHARRAGGDS